MPRADNGDIGVVAYVEVASHARKIHDQVVFVIVDIKALPLRAVTMATISTRSCNWSDGSI